MILWCYYNTYHIFFSRERALWNTVNVWDHMWRVTWRCFEQFGWSACVRSIEFPVLLKLVWQDFPAHSCKLCLQQFAAEFVSIRRCVSCWSCPSVYCFYKLIWSAPTITEKSLWESKVVFIFSCNSWVPSENSASFSNFSCSSPPPPPFTKLHASNDVFRWGYGLGICEL